MLFYLLSLSILFLDILYLINYLIPILLIFTKKKEKEIDIMLQMSRKQFHRNNIDKIFEA